MQENAHRVMASKQGVLKANALRGLAAREAREVDLDRVANQDSQVAVPMVSEQIILKANALRGLVVRAAREVDLVRVANPDSQVEQTHCRHYRFSWFWTVTEMESFPEKKWPTLPKPCHNSIATETVN